MRQFNHESTTTDVLAGIDLSAKRVLITGATAGLGWESARALAAAGAEIILTARNANKFADAKARILESNPNAQLHYCELQLHDLTSCREAAVALKQNFDHIDYVIANAGVMACEEQRTEQGFEWQFGVNHLGHFVFVNHLLPLLKDNHCRVVVLSSGGHRYADVDLNDPNFNEQPYDKWVSYGRAKTANALFAVELNRRMPHGTANAVHPGAIHTSLSRHMQAEDMAVMGASMRDSGIVMKPLECGAATQVWAVCSPELEGHGGLYLEDCQIGVESANPASGYSAYALDPANARQLWDLSERLVGESY